MYPDHNCFSRKLLKLQVRKKTVGRKSILERKHLVQLSSVQENQVLVYHKPAYKIIYVESSATAIRHVYVMIHGSCITSSHYSF